MRFYPIFHTVTSNNKKNILLSVIDALVVVSIALLSTQSCSGQIDKNRNKCSRKTTDKSLSQTLPPGICIPLNYTIEEVITNLDFDRDKKSDVVLRYSEYPLKTGATRFYAIYKRTGDTTFVLKKELKNIMPPYLKNIYAAVAGSDTVALRLAVSYPYDLRIVFIQDTIKISHLIPDYYGKTYSFVFKSNNWYLKQVAYWIGDLDERDVTQMDLSPKLLKRNVLETKRIDNIVPIDKFSLVQCRRKAETEEKEYLMENYDLLEWSNENK